MYEVFFLVTITEDRRIFLDYLRLAQLTVRYLRYLA